MPVYPQDPNYPYGPQVPPPPRYLTGIQQAAPDIARTIGGFFGPIAGIATSAGAGVQQHATAGLVKHMARESERYAREGRPVKVEQGGGHGLGGWAKRTITGQHRLMNDTLGLPAKGGMPVPIVGGVYDALKNPSDTTGSGLYGDLHVTPQDRVAPTGGPGPAVARSQDMQPTSYGPGIAGAGPRMTPAPARPNMLMQHLQSQQAPALGAGQPMLGGQAPVNGGGASAPGAGAPGMPGAGGGLTSTTAASHGNGGGSQGRTPLAPPLNQPYNNPGNTNTGGNNPVHRTFRGLLQQGIPDSEEARYYDEYTGAVNQGQTQLNDYLARSGDTSGYNSALQGGFQMGAAQAFPKVHQEFVAGQRAYLQDLIRMWRGTRKGGGGYVPNAPGSGFGQTLAGAGAVAQGAGSIIGAIRGGASAA